MTTLEERFRLKLAECYPVANARVEAAEKYPHGESVEVKATVELARLKHACRGAALTLLVYKLVNPDQDIRAHKDEYPNGFSARRFDTRETIPFLIEHSLPRSVESHWLTQTLSFAPSFTHDCVLKTTPKRCGPLLIDVVNYGQIASAPVLQSMVEAIVCELIKIRNDDKVILTRPKALSIDKVKKLLVMHFQRGYKSSAPRLPQLAIYAMYQSLMPHVKRYEGQKLTNLERLKSADRKRGTVGDIVVEEGGVPVEAVEIKFNKPISATDVSEAIDKVRAASVRRYYLLSTSGTATDDEDRITALKTEFLERNGCEIIVNGVVESIGYYLRLLSDTSSFLANYAELVEVDHDTAYEHRIAWNECCSEV